MSQMSRRLPNRRAVLRQAFATACSAATASTAWGLESPGFQVARSAVGQLPPVPLITMAGKRTTLSKELDTDSPLWLNFVFTTCSTTCSMQTAVLAALQARGVRESRRFRFLSLTIDPDNDTPEQLARFAARFGIQTDWNFCTGRFDDMLLPQQVFDVYRGSKSAHPPVVMLRAHRGAPWLRVTGFPTAGDLYTVLSNQPARAT